MNKSSATAQVKPESEGVKKIAPYPFSVNLKGPTTSYPAKALKLVLHGLLVEVDQGVLKVGDKLDIVFDLPASCGFIEAPISVVKTYDRQVPAKDGVKIQRIVEVHFTKPLEGSQKQAVKNFLKEINQSGPEII